ncbi:IucA/IucC family protein [Streptomyces tanashiensis]|uniref:IucA/IucC family siderophore biosynthesis protein n=1 Tax=Streptomyces tanashiensis TaxID=67367 RepID=A0ABY6R2C3_9ACTN|nr:IucA/IucC family protein [Streptomyces tanashiensis]UZX23916.1 IucA/IucC family siderophore biosynthesis protein [Streptomyces tanashiensis]
MHSAPDHDTGALPAPRAPETAPGAEASTARELADAAPRLLAAYHRELPPARAAVLGRLWRALLHEPLPGIAARDARTGRVKLTDGRVLSGPPRLPYDLVAPGEDTTVRLDGRAHDRPAALLAELGLPGADALLAELDHSVASLALSRAGAARAASAPGAGSRSGGVDPLAYIEQSVVDGHPYHPCCRSRPGLAVAEQLAYAPEHRPVVGLDLVAVPAGRCRVAGEWPDRLRDGDRLLLPVHPWQSAHVLPELGHRPYVTGAIPARPLMSVRTLAPLAGGPHLKTALTTRMTSAIRDISASGVENSAPLSALLGHVVADLADTLRITRNLAGASALVRGEPSADLAVLLRESPAAAARLRPGETILPVAALAARPAGDGPPLIRTLLAAAGAPDAGTDWLAAFADLAVPPLLRLLSRGVAPAAHGQNLLVVLDAHARPRRLVYRDLADVRLSPGRLARHGFDAAPVGGRVIDDDPEVLRTMLFGHLFGTTFGTLVSALADHDRTAGTRLWRVVAAAAGRACDGLPASPENRADRAALFAPELRVKALTLMRLRGVDRDEWMPLPNPLADPPQRKCTS